MTVTAGLEDEGKAGEIRVVRFDGEKGDLRELDASRDGSAVTFETEGTSVISLLDFSLEERSVNARIEEKRGVLYENDDILLEGSMPADGIVEARQVDVEAGGQEALVAYDIKIYADEYMKAAGITWQPDKEPVRVTIKSDALGCGSAAVYHLKDQAAEPECISPSLEVRDGSVTFEAAGFSIYAVVEVDAEPTAYGETASGIDELSYSRAMGGFYMSISRGTSSEYYFTSDVKESGSDSVLEESGDSAAAVWYLEPVEGQYGQFRIYTLKDGNKKYIKQISPASNNNITLADDGSIFEATFNSASGRFYFKVAGTNKYLQHSGSGGGIRLYDGASNAGNSRVLLTYVAPVGEEDPYGLDGETFGIMNRRSGTVGYGMLSDPGKVGNADALRAREMLVRTDPLVSGGLLYVARETDLVMWTFEKIEEDRYYLKSQDGYMRIGSNGSVTIVPEPDEYCVIRVTPGNGANAGKVRLTGTKSNRTINLHGSNQAFYGNAENTGANVWQNLVRESVYSEDDFVEYTARKVSVSDGVNVPDGSQVVVYTRVWNEEKKQYEFYAVDYKGDLVPCFESGDSLVWVGPQVNTALWNFTEYHNPGTNVPSGYYELQNTYSGAYIAPQIGDGRILSDTAPGINLNGRYAGDYFTPILSWDDTYYDYAGFKVENGKIVSCPMSQADTFYFAVIELKGDELTPVETVDHEANGLTLKIIDKSSQKQMSAILGNNDGGMGNVLHQGILSTRLEDNGYPMTMAGRSLSEMYAGAEKANHLFINSIYEGSGYYQFDSSENFAHYEGNQFTVYQELGSVPGKGNTHTHGQFMPFNTLDPSRAHPDNPNNLTDIYGQPLSDSHPRKYEPLYDYEEDADFHFAMELEGHFVMSPDGLDDWGHDIIFEFVGDDDFWLYVDGELVIDLGGIHSAVPGSVNYSTGDVIVNGVPTTIKDIFYNNYLNRDNHTPDQAQAYVDSIFQEKQVNGRTCYVFKDYTAHDIRIFYMERGAGASNLRMRFNMSTVSKDQFLLKKEIRGTDKQDFVSARFPFQIYYQTEEGGEYRLLEQGLAEGTDAKWKVVYYNSSTKVPYKASDQIDGVTYRNVFYLKPGQSAVVTVPENTISYYVKECGVDSSIYNHVYINDEEAQGEVPEGATHTKTFQSVPSSLEDQARVTFGNEVDPDLLRNLSVTKRLFDSAGNELSSEEDSTGFTMRLFLGDELGSYAQGQYYVKDADGNYCRFDAASQSFVSLSVRDFGDLTEEQLAQATFTTSPNGAVSKIPAGHTIEVRGLMVGTRFRVTEEPYDLPAGYGYRQWSEDGKTYTCYKRVEGSFYLAEGDTQNSGVIRDNSNPAIEIHNQRGWGLRAEKKWSDEDFMLSHEDIYAGVFVGEDLLPGSVHQINAYNYTTWFFPDLVEGASFDDYEIREVKLTDPVVQDYYTVTYSRLEVVGEDGIKLSGTTVDGIEESDLTYYASYSEGTPSPVTGNEGEVRTDTITNSRKGGLTIEKRDREGEPLSGAVFTMMKGETREGTFTSGTDGFVTAAYLENGAYTLTEIRAPAGFRAPDTPISITQNGASCSVSCDDPGAYSYDVENSRLVIYNDPYTLKARKVDASGGEPLENAHFALYRQVEATGGTVQKDYYPIDGYEDLISGQGGVIPGIDQTLSPGSYYLTETRAPEGFTLEDPVREVLFTITDTGQILLTEGAGFTGSLVHEGSDYTILVPNGKPPDIIVPVPTNAPFNSPPYLIMLISGFLLLAGIFYAGRRSRHGPRLLPERRDGV
ncbi:MAG: hypothetical protein II628_10685 [Lachnospiraceae bacterium]|nr:hypothetical protein [Lachnospiraceae bacterium]